MEDIGLLLVRGLVGVLLMGHGVQKLFGWFGGDGLDRVGEGFTRLGYPRGRHMAVLAGLTEVAAGVGLAAGLLTPLVAAAVIGVMVNAAVSVHGRAGLWVQHGGYEYPLVLATLAAGVAIHGPGGLSLDAALGLARTGIGWGLGAVAFGLAAAAAILATRSRAGRHQATSS